MDNISQGRSVLSPDKYKEVYVDPVERTRQALFIGAIMNFAELVHKSADYKCYRDAASARSALSSPFECAEEIMRLLDYCIDKQWNVAFEMLKWQNDYIKRSRDEKRGVPEIILPPV